MTSSQKYLMVAELDRFYSTPGPFRRKQVPTLQLDRKNYVVLQAGSWSISVLSLLSRSIWTILQIPTGLDFPKKGFESFARFSKCVQHHWPVVGNSYPKGGSAMCLMPSSRLPTYSLNLDPGRCRRTKFERLNKPTSVTGWTTTVLRHEYDFCFQVQTFMFLDFFNMVIVLSWSLRFGSSSNEPTEITVPCSTKDAYLRTHDSGKLDLYILFVSLFG